MSAMAMNRSSSGSRRLVSCAPPGLTRPAESCISERPAWHEVRQNSRLTGRRRLADGRSRPGIRCQDTLLQRLVVKSRNRGAGHCLVPHTGTPGRRAGRDKSSQHTLLMCPDPENSTGAGDEKQRFLRVTRPVSGLTYNYMLFKRTRHRQTLTLSALPRRAVSGPCSRPSVGRSRGRRPVSAPGPACSQK